MNTANVIAACSYGSWYLCSPYTHADESVITARYDEACKAIALLMRASVDIYSPIVHTHVLHARHGLPMNYAFYRHMDESRIAASDGIVILMLNGWAESFGVGEECKFAESLYKPVIFWEW